MVSRQVRVVSTAPSQEFHASLQFDRGHALAQRMRQPKSLALPLLLYSSISTDD